MFESTSYNIKDVYGTQDLLCGEGIRQLPSASGPGHSQLPSKSCSRELDLG